jgi:predicted HicB family RNase H-like nuclease
MSRLNYTSYLASVEFESEDRLFVGQIAGINDVVGFHAESVAELEAAFRDAVDDYVATFERIGKSPERPFSGRVMFRVDPRIHARAALAAQLRGVSLNQWAEEALDPQAGAALSQKLRFSRLLMQAKEAKAFWSFFSKKDYFLAMSKRARKLKLLRSMIC